MGLPEAQGYDALLVVVDRAKKQMHAIPTTEETSALGLAKLYRDNVWRYHGLPDSIISDRGPQFAAALMKELNKLLKIQTKTSTAYHPQTDGQTERVNQDVEQYLRLFVNHRQDDWPEWIALGEFAYNNRIHSAIQVSPFFANYGYNPRMGFEPRREGKVEAAEDFAERMKRVHEEAHAALTKARDEMKRYADQIRGEAPAYKVGDKVWLESEDLQINRPSRKLAEKRLGPYPITEIVSQNAVKLKLPTSIKIHPVINVSRVRPHTASTIPEQRAEAPPPVQIEGELEYHVEEVLDSRLRRNQLQYLVKWQGYTEENNTWEPAANLEHATDAIAAFHRTHPAAPRQLRSLAHFRFRPYENFTDTPEGFTSRLESEP